MASEESVPDLQLPHPGALLPHPILIVDDNSTNRRILEIQLKAWGVRSASASSGPEGRLKIAEQTFDLVLIDFQIPDMDGVLGPRDPSAGVYSSDSSFILR